MPPRTRPLRSITGQERADYLSALEEEADWRVRELVGKLSPRISGAAAHLLVLRALERTSRMDAERIRSFGVETEAKHCAPASWPKD